MATPESLNIPQQVIERSRLPENDLFDLLNRDAALWICGPEPETADEREKLAGFITLPWKMVLSELSSKGLIDEISTHGAKQDFLSQHRGFVHIVASDPSVRPLPVRALPIFLLNGRDDASDRAESSNLTGIAANRRRLNMLERLEASSPKRIFIVGENIHETAQELAELFDGNFRSLLTFVVPSSVTPDSIRSHFEATVSVSSLSVVSTELRGFLNETIERSTKLFSDSKILLRVRNYSGDLREVDITDAELVEQPLLDHFDIIKSKDLQRLTEFDLTEDDHNDFFDKSKHSWRTFAAGLPWIPDQKVIETVLRSLEKVHHKKIMDIVPIHYIASEAGAGGTTFARAVAFCSAAAGFPTLIAKPHLYEPNAIEVSSFLYRSLTSIKTSGTNVENDRPVQEPETPWLLVFDREQWEGQEEALKHFSAELARSGRSVVILKVLGSDIPTQVDISGEKILYTLTHRLEREQVLDLGKHLNKYLKPLKQDKKEHVWLRFWEEHRPDPGGQSIAAFWVILEFWLKGMIDLGESIPGWLLKQFKDAPITRDVRRIVLEIAALSVERRAIPEHLLPIPEDDTLPLSVILENLRTSIPGLALIRYQSESGRYWAVAHDVLARYLMTAVYYDRPLLQEIDLGHIQSSVEFRLSFIARLTRRTALGEKRFLPYAVQFPLRTLKLGEPEGNRELFPYWRNILEMLEGFPNAVKDGSRTFIHHMAISRRRVARYEEFEASVDECQFQLRTAITEIEFALENLEEIASDESNLNLYNSLALTYQDLASHELQQNGVSDVVRSLRKKAHEAISKALKENPTNSYVLETAAKNMLQQAKFGQSGTINAAAQALAYTFQATALENSYTRQNQLGKLATNALQLLQDRGAADEIAKMRATGNAMGYLASAWLELMRDTHTVTEASLSSYSKESARAAVEILSEAPTALAYR